MRRMLSSLVVVKVVQLVQLNRLEIPIERSGFKIRSTFRNKIKPFEVSILGLEFWLSPKGRGYNILDPQLDLHSLHLILHYNKHI